MHPIERLRWIARASGEPSATIASEAAWALGELAQSEPAAVLTASRRLVERHPACGPLWWVCAQLVMSDDPSRTAASTAGELASDPVPQRVAAALGSEFTASDPLACTAPTELVRSALSLRPNSTVRVLGAFGELRREVRALGSVVDEVTGYGTDELPQGLDRAAVLLVEPLLAGPDGLLVSVAAAQAVEAAIELSVPVWAVLGVGSVLPADLATAAAELAGADYEVIAPERLTSAVDASGRGPVRASLARTTCPACPELVPRGPSS
jgi:hypothetical protein